MKDSTDAGRIYGFSAATEAAPMPHNPNGVLMIANLLIDAGHRRVIVVSPEGDPASAGSVKLLRNWPIGESGSSSSI